MSSSKLCITVAVALSAAMLLQGCYLFKDPPVDRRIAARLKGRGGPIDNQPAGVPVGPIATPQAFYGAEVTWEIPEEPADSYVIYFGQAPDLLTSEKRPQPNELTTFRDVNGKQRYRYVLKPIDPNQPLYVAIAALRGDLLSERSEVQEVQAKPSTPQPISTTVDPAAALQLPTPAAAVPEPAIEPAF